MVPFQDSPTGRELHPFQRLIADNPFASSCQTPICLCLIRASDPVTQQFQNKWVHEAMNRVNEFYIENKEGRRIEGLYGSKLVLLLD